MSTEYYKNLTARSFPEIDYMIKETVAYLTFKQTSNAFLENDLEDKPRNY